ncbi:MAG: lysophospholipase [Myxococcales bacterium]|nr:lysophospholipase [Myxococcales bacterium]
MSEISCSHDYINSRDGTRLHTVQWQEPAEIRARLLFVHGWAEYIGRYQFPVSWFQPKGFACHGLDYRGHGESEGRPGYVRDWRNYLDDVEAFLRTIPRDDDIPLFLVGHSQGGLIVSRLLEERGDFGLSGLILSSPFFALGRDLTLVENVMSRVLSRVAPTMPLPSGVGAEGISKDPAVVRAYENDPKIVKKPLARWANELMKAQAAVVVEAPRVTVPCLVMGGTDDPVVSVDQIRAFYEACGSEDKTLEMFEGLRHEIFNELERADVFACMEAWLNGRLSAQSVSI